MCGIYVLGTAPGPGTAVPETEFRQALSAVLAHAPARGGAARVHAAMDALRAAAQLFLRCAPQLAVIADSSLKAGLAQAAEDLETWLARAEAHAARGACTTAENEAANVLITVARDTAWLLRNDVLANAGRIRTLLGATAANRDALAHAWQLNLILNNIDRLEVRGRDSAGVAAYAYLPDAGTRQRFLAAHPDAPYEHGVDFPPRTVTLPAGRDDALLFAFKTAQEVGEIGENVAELRRQITAHGLFQDVLRVPGVRLCALAHTRWASNGVISVPNCHPVDSTALAPGGTVDAHSRGRFIAVLNGDIDNYQELRREVLASGLELPPQVTTDAKIIPVMMEHLRRRGRSAREAFEEMVDRFAGSMAIACLAAERPGELYLAQKGSGQGLFLGLAGESLAVASEMYGIVELTSATIKAEGERAVDGRTAGERFHVVFEGERPSITLADGSAPAAQRIRRAEITTRDIDRGSYPRYLLKEINESVRSVRNTLRGVLHTDGGAPRIALGEDALPAALLARMKAGAIRRVIATGQGTAAVAGQGIATLLNAALAGAGIACEAMQATELSGNYLRTDMSDTLVVAVSQSGTTTDTNRTVDLVRARGAFVIGIVNRRNSDLVYKADSVLYTSDGRDIEMSVASTKAFYAQNTAGQLLALALARHLGSLSEDALRAQAAALEALPDAMTRTLARSDLIRDIAAAHALARRHWAIVGTGCGRIAADEIRIKLSELCYKSVAVDFLEDKKHIDLSSEPLIIACVAGLPPQQVGDAVKEIAIFKAHKAIPIVVVDEGENRFTPYAAASITVPRHDGSLAFLLPVMVGHLFGYHAADCFEREANRLRRLRGRVVDAQPGIAGGGAPPPGVPLAEDGAFVSDAVRVQERLLGGELNSGLEAGTAARLNEVLDFVLGRFHLDLLPVKFRLPGTVKNLLAAAADVFSAAIAELTRPIDAIKHQAKTVTVGISRIEEVVCEGPLWSLVDQLALPRNLVPTSAAHFLTAFGRLIHSVNGSTHYRVSGLTPLGRPGHDTQLDVIARRGAARDIPSRYDAPRPLLGTKRRVVEEHRPYLGFGHKDSRAILIVPFVSAAREGALLLAHIALIETGDRAARLAALQADADRFRSLVAAVTEHDVPWSEDLIEGIDNATLFLREPAEAARLIVEAARRSALSRA